jgi:hypothetical protein
MTRWIEVKGLELMVANFCHGTGNGHRWSANNSLGNKVSLFWPLLFDSFQLRYSLTSAQMELVPFILTIRAYSLAGSSTALD